MAESTFADDFKQLIADSGLPKVFGFIGENIGKATSGSRSFLSKTRRPNSMASFLWTPSRPSDRRPPRKLKVPRCLV
jgi:hypothetical protein